MSNLPAPRYSLWQAVSAALNLSLRAIEEVRALSREPGPPGDKGDRGVDGLGFDDLDVVFDGDRTITIKMVRGDQTKEWPITFPVVLDRGVWRAGAFQKGDGVTLGGQFYIAQRETSAEPMTPDAKDDWRLAVKKGRDGKDLRPDDGKSSGPVRFK